MGVSKLFRRGVYFVINLVVFGFILILIDWFISAINRKGSVLRWHLGLSPPAAWPARQWRWDRWQLKNYLWRSIVRGRGLCDRNVFSQEIDENKEQKIKQTICLRISSSNTLHRSISMNIRCHFKVPSFDVLHHIFPSIRRDANCCFCGLF